MLQVLDKKLILNTYSKKDINFIKGENATLFDNNGTKYIDFASGVGVVSIGHGNKDIADTIYNQVLNITHISNLYTIEPQLNLAQKLVQLSNFDMKCFFSNSGAEANEAAIKIARKYGQKKYNGERFKIITLENSFHGRTLATAKATGQSKIHKNDFAPYPEGFIFYKDIDDIYENIDNNTVAVMLELIQGEGGVQPLNKSKIQQLSLFLKQKDILLIIDEVQTGIYRTGVFLASHLYEITPDIITLAKGLGNGIPIGVTITTQKDIFELGDHGSTFGGNYLSTTVGLKVCEILEKYFLNKLLEKTIEYFNMKLEKFYKQFSFLFIEIVGIGLIKGIRIKDERILEQLINRAFKNKVLILRAGKNTLRFLPPLTISEKEINKGFKYLYEGLRNENFNS